MPAQKANTIKYIKSLMKISNFRIHLDLTRLIFSEAVKYFCKSSSTSMFDKVAITLLRLDLKKEPKNVLRPY